MLMNMKIDCMKALRLCLVLVMAFPFATLKAQERTSIDIYVENLENGNCYFYDVDEVRVHGMANCTHHSWTHRPARDEFRDDDILVITKTNGNIGVWDYWGDNFDAPSGPMYSLALAFGVYLGSDFLHLNLCDGFEIYGTTYCCANYDGIVLHGEPNNQYYCFLPSSATSVNLVGMTMAVITRDTQGQWWSDGFNCDLEGHYFYYSSGIPPTEPWPEDQMLKCQGIVRLYAQSNPQDDYTYLWSNGATTPYIDVSNLGTYSVTVTDACGNVVSDQVTIAGEYPIHEPYLPDTTFFCEGNPVTLNAGSGFTSYLWSDSTSGPTLTVTEPGEYWVRTVNEYGCDGMASTKVMYIIPPMIDESIPRVTIDTIGKTNRPMLVWNTTDLYTDQVAVYREVTTNQWQQVGVADYEAGRYIDAVDASERSWRYKLAAVDVCGDEAEKGCSYQTMNAAYLGPGVDGTYWVQWTPYKVADVNNSVDHYELYSVDNLEDFNERLVDEEVLYDGYFGTYYVNLPHGIQDSLFFVRAYVKQLYGGGTVMSNFMENYEILDVKDDFIETTVFRVYPNPSNGAVTVEGEGRLKVFNLLGQVVIDLDMDGKLTLTLPSGMYLVRLVNGMVNETRKVVVE